MTIMMKLLLIVSFLALTDAWWYRIISPAKKYNLAAKGLDQAGQNNPAKLIIGALQYLNEGIDSLKERVDMLEGQVQDIKREIERDMTIMMKLLLIVSFLTLTDAWWYGGIKPTKKGNVDQAGQDNPAKLIIGALLYLNGGIESLKERVDMLEGQVQDIEAVLSGQGGQEPGPEGTVNQEPPAGGQEPVRSDETAVRMLLQKLGSRLEEKKSEQKKGN